MCKFFNVIFFASCVLFIIFGCTRKALALEKSISETKKSYDTEANNKDQHLEDMKILASQGDADAQYNLANIYSDNIRFPKDMVKAVNLYHLSAKQGHDDAQMKLAHCYQNGLGVSHDKVKAYIWFGISAKNSGKANGRGRAGELQDKISKDLTQSERSQAINEISRLEKEIFLKVQSNYNIIINELNKEGWDIEMDLQDNGNHVVTARNQGKTSTSKATNWRLAFNSVKRLCLEWPKEETAQLQ